MAIEDIGSSNHIEIGSNITAKGKVAGKNNTVIIKSALHPSTADIFINCENNSIIIEIQYCINLTSISDLNHIPAHNVDFYGRKFAY